MPKKASRGFDKLKRWVSDLSSAELEGLTGALTAHAIPQQFAKPLVRSSRPHGQSALLNSLIGALGAQLESVYAWARPHLEAHDLPEVEGAGNPTHNSPNWESRATCRWWRLPCLSAGRECT